MPIQVAVSAPTQAIRAGLRVLLSADEEIAVVAEARSMADLEESQARVDVLIDAYTGEKSITSAQAQVAASSPALLLITDDEQAARRITHRATGAWGVLPLDVSGEELRAAVHALYEGLLVGTPLLVKAAFNPQVRTQEEEDDTQIPPEPLTSREIEVLQLLAQGLANKQIAAALDISENTVKFHISSIYAKLGAVNRTEAVRIGARRGLILL
ncbi:MAG: LuxR C-terminal-related transcriptional regulator [Omnitrophica WOR_2 bacterium]